jgi:hypothetical protein
MFTIIAMKEVSCELFCSRCVGHGCHVPSGRSCSICRPAVLYQSQCQVSADSAELVQDVKTVANRTDSILTTVSQLFL